MIERAIERSGIAKRIGFLALQVPHLLDYVDALRGVQHLVKYPGAFEPEIHQDEVDIVVASAAGFERVVRSLLLFQARAHLRQLFPRAAALPVAAPVYLLKLMQEFSGALGIAGYGARFHVGDALPGLRAFPEILLVGALSLYQIAIATVGAEASV